MPHTKTDTAFRYPQNDEQSRRLRNTTQNQRAADRQQFSSQSATAASLAADPTSSWGPEEYFETTVDEYDGARMNRGVSGQDEADAFEAANDKFD
ncbi:uncharacterized protein An03g01640 [Aspergillus niger]|uniref:Contig An03c0050, genomic contig n=2 Tax=Aspergillus niger TaxID=5061 RepID=A2QG27_ASPNC|nr:uncharacterized protein An03g01640 [Aspergillus niger]CAK38137.1 unnamed protein product [Aspergillus niger]